MSQQIDLSAVQTDDLSTVLNVKPVPLAPLPRAGYNLSRIILCMIGGYVLFLIGYITFAKLDASDKIDLSSKSIITDSINFAHQKELIKSYQEEKKSSRDFVSQITQMVLLNILLPTLTAILGYIFGSREEAKKNLTRE